MTYLSGNSREVRDLMRYAGDYIQGPRALTARFPLASLIVDPPAVEDDAVIEDVKTKKGKKSSKTSEENKAMTLKAGESAELLLTGQIRPHSHVIEVAANPALHALGIMRMPSFVSPDEEFRVHFTAIRPVDFSSEDLAWIVQARIRETRR